MDASTSDNYRIQKLDIAEDLPDPGDNAIKGSVRNDVKGKVDAGIIRI